MPLLSGFGWKADNRQTAEMVSSPEPVIAVLEIAGGRSAELGIKAGDRVEWRD